MKTKEEIVANWLPRYTKRNLEDFGEYILLTNFNKYVEIFAEKFNVPILGKDANMISASAEGMTIINFGMGSPNAAIIMDLLSAIRPKACLFLGKCGGIDKKNRIGDLILPIAAIRGEGTSNDYFPPEFLVMFPNAAVGGVYGTGPVVTGIIADGRRNGTLQHKCRE